MISEYEQREIEQIAQNWRLTPATVAYKLSKGSWIPKPHLLYISLRIATGIARGNARIIISVPPRHGKSELASVYTPIQILENDAKKRIILASYGKDLALIFGRRVRDIFASEDFSGLLKTRLSEDSRRVALWNTDAGGYMSSVGLGGPITGFGADVLLIDDYIKEVKEALSSTYREYVWDWFVTTAFTRLEPGGSCIIIATRWHTDDLIGKILKEFPGQWEYIEIPAIATKNDIIGRQQGEVLFPERYNMQQLQERKTLMGSVWFDAIYQQRPVDESQKITDGTWLKTIPALPDELKYRRVRVWDLAATEGGGDYTAGVLCGYRSDIDDFVILDMKREQLDPGNVEKLVKKTALDEDGPDVEIYIEQDPGSAGKALINHYKTNVLQNFIVKPYPVNQKKLIRAQPFIAAAEARKISQVQGLWNPDWVREFDKFPGGEFDDQVDVVGDAYTILTGRRVFTVSWGRNKGLQPSNDPTQTHQTNLLPTRSDTERRKAAGTFKLIRGVTFGRNRPRS